MTKTIKEINEFINKLDKDNFYDDYSNYMSDYLNDDFLEELEQGDLKKCLPHIAIYEELEERGFFDIEVTYYSNAIKYLQENDPSFKESLKIADGMGFNLKNLNSEILASLLASNEVREKFSDLENDFINFFTE